MKPGIYENLPFEQYLDIDAISNTALGNMALSPRHYLHCVELDRCKPLVLGSLVHCGRFEPMAIAERYAVMPDFHLDKENVTGNGELSTSKSTRYTKARTAEFVHANQDKEVVSAGWYQEAKDIVSSLYSDLPSRTILAADQYELTLVWEDAETGLLCKARLDAVKHSCHIADLKTTADLSGFANSFYRYGYYRQAAHYQEGWARLTGEILSFWITAVEKSKPFCVMTAPVAQSSIEFGFNERAELLAKIVECEQAKHWPGPESPDEWRIPEWAEAKQPLDLIINGEKVSI
jgi:hypothetical protein